MSQVSSKVRPILTTQDKIKVFTTESFEQKCRYLCNKYPNREWIGMLFYNIRDVNKDMSQFEIDVVDFYPMSVDTAGHTDFLYDSTYVAYVIANNLSDAHSGLIHSHNTMPVFFSSEDMSELQDNTENHTFYLSLIVNNFLEFCAKICTIIKMPESKKIGIYKDINGKDKKLAIEDDSKEFLFTVDAVINKSMDAYDINQTWVDQVNIIDFADKTKVKPVIGFHQQGHQGNLFPGKAGFDDWNSSDYFPAKVNKSKFADANNPDEFKQFVTETVLGARPTDNLYTASKDYDYMPGEVEDFIVFYDEQFGKTDQKQEIAMLKNMVIMLKSTPVKATKDILALIKEVNQTINDKQQML